MLRRIKCLYNRWLFKRYGFDRGALFERIPLLYKLCPLFSPSAYSICEGKQICTWIKAGMEEAEKHPMNHDPAALFKKEFQHERKSSQA